MDVFLSKNLVKLSFEDFYYFHYRFVLFSFLYCTKIIIQQIALLIVCNSHRRVNTTTNGDRSQFFASSTVNEPDVQFNMCPIS